MYIYIYIYIYNTQLRSIESGSSKGDEHSHLSAFTHILRLFISDIQTELSFIP